MTTTLIDIYRKKIDAEEIHSDEKQQQAIVALQKIYDALVQRKNNWFSLKRPIVEGVYLYGRVGTGKTFLMDLFYQTLPLSRKMRMHFHQFMRMVHEKLKIVEGQKNPLKILAKEMAKQVDVICFDEFLVVNIVDAMLLGNLLEALYAEGMTLLMTSNVYPDELYKDGLQRERFLPAIELIKKYNDIICVDSGIDYRQGKADYDRAYFYPQSTEMQEMLFSRFRELAGSPIEFQKNILINQRPIKTVYAAEKAVWFDFLILCSIPRSQLDYLVLAKEYPYVFLSNLRIVQHGESDLICNFINLIDVFYDARVKLYILADVPFEKLYTKGLETFAFQRTESRLAEMQSRSYLKEPVRY